MDSTNNIPNLYLIACKSTTKIPNTQIIMINDTKSGIFLHYAELSVNHLLSNDALLLIIFAYIKEKQYLCNVNGTIE